MRNCSLGKHFGYLEVGEIELRLEFMDRKGKGKLRYLIS